MAIAFALVAHTCAAFLLCWAARPVGPARSKGGASGEDMAADTFRSYRRGWIATMIAMGLSAIALTVFAIITLGTEPQLRTLFAR
jgi:hypothetical protein